MLHRDPELTWRGKLQALGFPIPKPPTPVHSSHLTSARGSYKNALLACREFAAVAPENVQAWQALSVVCQRLGYAQEWVKARTQVARLQVLESNIPTAARADVERFLLCAEGAAADTPACVPEVYVARTFDAYAGAFDEHLLGALHYRTHFQVARAVKRDALERPLDILDLGCGTGLVGLQLAGIARQLCGIDISANMIAKAMDRNVYTRLECTSITSYLESTADRYDVLVAADVVNYLGELENLLLLMSRVLREAGVVVFSIEHAEDNGTYRLKPNRRFVHGLGYVHRSAVDAGFDVEAVDAVVLRRENNEDVAGEIVTLRIKPV